MGLGGTGGVSDRLRLLLDDRSACGARGARALAAAMIALVLALGAAVPAAAVVGAGQVGHAAPVHHCPT